MKVKEEASLPSSKKKGVPTIEKNGTYILPDYQVQETRDDIVCPLPILS